MTLALIAAGVIITGLSITVAVLALWCREYHTGMLAWEELSDGWANNAGQWQSLYEMAAHTRDEALETLGVEVQIKGND